MTTQKETQTKIQKLEDEMKERDAAMQKLDSQRAEREAEKKELADEQANLLAGIVFAELDRIFKVYITLQDQFSEVKEKVQVLALKDKNWYQRAEEQGLHALFSTVADSYLRVQDLPTLSLGTFMSQVAKFDSGMGEGKRKYEGLEPAL